MSKFYTATRDTLDISAGKNYEVYVNAEGLHAFLDDVGDQRYLKEHFDDNAYMVPASPVDEPTTTNPFLKTETRIVDGSYVFESSCADIQIEVGRNDVMIRTDAFYDKQSLAELARILKEISEAMA